MKFSTRLTLSAIVPALLFIAALGASLIGLLRTQDEFGRLMAREQKLALGYAELYGHGLQMGQALRNIVLDPANPKAYDNLKAAAGSYGQTHAELGRVAAGSAFEAAHQGLAQLRATQEAAQQEVLSLARTDQGAAIAVLNGQETPAWRALRAELMKLGEAARKQAAAEQAFAEGNAAAATLLALVMAGIAAAVAGAFLLGARRTVRRELGGDPKEAGAVLRRIAAGDLSVDVAAGTHPHSLMAELSGMQESLRALVGRVRASSESILVASAEVATGSTDLSARTEQAASSLQETAASMEQITASVKNSAEAASTAHQLVGSAADTARKGGEVVSGVIGTMDEISESSRRIVDIIGVIDGIAFQTNILALNAAVEAARAGEQGRGFAVVAGEVRVLARRSADAAMEIKALITSSAEKVEAGSTLVATAGSSMTDIMASVQRVSEFIGEINAASTEQSTGVQQIGAAVSSLDDMTQQNAALVEESAAAAESLKEQARKLSALVGEFRLPADRPHSLSLA